MKKLPRTATVQDQANLPSKCRSYHPAKQPPFVPPSSPALIEEHQKVSYVPGENPRKEPSALPRLFIRGLGGSIKLDLGGVGIRFSAAVFAHFVADDSLRSLHVDRGDIALLEPVFRRLHDRNLLLLELDGHPVIRRLRKVKGLWMLDSMTGSTSDLVPLVDQAIQGVVIGFIRVLKKLRPVKFVGTEANFSANFEKPALKVRRRSRANPSKRPCRNPPLIPSLAQLRKFLAANRTAQTRVWLSEIDEAIRYLA